MKALVEIHLEQGILPILQCSLHNGLKHYFVIEDGLVKRLQSQLMGLQLLTFVVRKSRIPKVLRELHDSVSGDHFGMHLTLEQK